MLDNLSKDTAVSSTDNKHFLGVGVGVHGEVGDHLLVTVAPNISKTSFKNHCRRYNARKLVSLSALDNIIQDQNSAVVTALEDKDVLVIGLLMVKNLVDPEVHGLTRPHVGDFRKPSIYRGKNPLQLAN